MSAGGRKAVLVLGMHRSGTSALARLLNLCGAALPEGLVEAAADVNAAGFWEARALLALHDEILEAAGGSWHDLRALDAGWFAGAPARAFRARLGALLASEYGKAPLLLVKDPRLCRLLPLWRPVLAELGIEPLVVLAVRHPLEVAASLRARDGFGEGKALLLWLRHVLAAEHASRGMRRAFVTYEQMLADAPGTVERLGRELELDWPRPPETVAAEMAAFLSPALRHHECDADEVLGNSAVPWEVREAYRWHIAAAAGEAPGDGLDAIAADLAVAEPLFGGALAALEDAARTRAAELRHWIGSAVERYEAIVTLRAYIEHQQREIDALAAHARAIESSRMWRALAPVRGVVRRLRGRGEVA
ncbi:hypothetical protein GCM10010909_04810 [Acidocella aquatica]|uniref:Sulfotransferase family protein n=1 Tax=Acidocella aquatica TaxID=1922313 RepID=A0ABQ6A358_9PROT|nr:sulfotransferase [Acidocella aquatica]GLR65803.1 hypothetical protein GCM10010909_04810 [Acidocella aquatica]